MADLESALGYTFTDPDLLATALTHRSLEAEDAAATSNERLEFLGDAVLGLVVASKLYDEGTMAEGAMAKVRAAVVDEVALAGVARRIGLGTELRLGRGEIVSGGPDKSSILSDALEAVIGAIYLDGGLAPAMEFILDHWEELIAARATAPGAGDYKTRLQEELARQGSVPEYDVVGTGPDHAREFSAVVMVDGNPIGSGEGSSKKRAEQQAAKQALGDLRSSDA